MAADERRSTPIDSPALSAFIGVHPRLKILLAQNSLYYPAHGGGDKSNRLLLEALAARGHECRVVARISVFGEAGHAQYLEDLAMRGVTPQSPPMEW